MAVPEAAIQHNVTMYERAALDGRVKPGHGVRGKTMPRKPLEI
jgi:hypothetical protein